jgi:sulfopyruvate decarboxylase TPP-binding subunit
MGGKRPVVLIQSTGFYESGDAVRGFCKDLDLPLLLLLGYRGYPGEGHPPRDSAAAMLEPMLKVWNIPYRIVTSDAHCSRISEAFASAEKEGRTEAVLFGREYE